MIHAKSPKEIEYMRDAGKVVAETHRELAKAVKPGISTKELDQIAEDYIISRGAKPSFKGYHGFPATICASPNHVVVHGIPGLDLLKDGDIISIDVGAVLNGYQGDAAQTLPVGEITPEAEKLIRVTEESFFEGMKYAKEGNYLYEISNAIGRYAEQYGYGVVRDLCGHGIGSHLHEAPEIPNYEMSRRGVRLRKGMTLAIEPMINMGTWQVDWLDDDWTVVTRDGSLSAHYENTVLITENGPVLLTLSK